MSKRTATRWFIGAWLVALACGILAGLAGRNTRTVSPPVTLLSLTIIVCGVVMFVSWVGALINLAQQHSWGWFFFLLVFYLLSVGVLEIIPMVAYAVAGPRDGGTPVVIRPSTS